MPHHCIHISTIGGLLDSNDLQGFALDRVGVVRALVNDPLIEVSLARSKTGGVRTVTFEA